MSQSKNILMTAGRSWITLDLARQLSALGHTIYVADSSNYHVSRFSNAVTKCFLIPSPRFEPEKFIDSLVEITKKEKIDFLLPNCEEIFYLSKALHRFPKSCTVFTSPFEIMHTLHNKWEFTNLLHKLNIQTPEAYLITSQEDLKNIPFKTAYILKPCYSRGSQKIQKVVPPQTPAKIEIEAYNPWIAQEWIEGKRYCTYGICHQGELRAHSVYPVNFAVDGNSCVTFESIEHPGIYNWIKEFVKEINFTGQIAFDFIEDERGLFAIECNPRATSGAHLFTEANPLDVAFFNTTNKTVLPTPGTKRQIAIGMFLYGWRKLPQNRTLKCFFKEFLSVKDVIFNFADLGPVLFSPLIYFNYMQISRKLGIRIPAVFTYDLEWNGEKHLLESKRISIESVKSEIPEIQLELTQEIEATRS